MSCSYTEDKKTSFCSDNDLTNNDVWRCDKQNYGTWKCGKIPRESGPSLPTDFKRALDLASGSAVLQQVRLRISDLISVKLIVCTSALRTYRTLLANHLPLCFENVLKSWKCYKFFFAKLSRMTVPQDSKHRSTRFFRRKLFLTLIVAAFVIVILSIWYFLIYESGNVIDNKSVILPGNCYSINGQQICPPPKS